MKNYVAPVVETLLFNAQTDVITSSLDNIGGWKDEWEVPQQ